MIMKKRKKKNPFCLILFFMIEVGREKKTVDLSQNVFVFLKQC